MRDVALTVLSQPRWPSLLRISELLLFGSGRTAAIHARGMRRGPDESTALQQLCGFAPAPDEWAPSGTSGANEVSTVQRAAA